MITKTIGVIAAVVLAVALLPLLAVPGSGGADLAGPAHACGDVAVILDTIRTVETGGNYSTTVTTSSASGAYAFIDAAWRHYAGLASVDTDRYPHAYLAPAADQDRVATIYVNEILDDHDGDVAVIPLAWYLPSSIGNPAKMDVVPAMGGNVLTPRQYQTRWMAVYQQKQAGSVDGPEAATCAGTVSADGTWALPAPADALAEAGISSPHHDYPAVDLMLPAGTPILAITAGTVVRTTHFAANWWRAGCTLTGTDGCATCGVGVTIQSAGGLRHTYCHNTTLHVHTGDQVAPGQHIADSGDTGRSGAPHLHLELRLDDTRRCPQPLLEALYSGQPTIPDPASLPTGGCSF